MENHRAGLSKTTLQMIACAAMFMDHFSKTVLSSSAFKDVAWANYIAIMMTLIGRIAFPIFAFFVAEGCRKTSEPGRYLMRLLTFAIIAEVPFQLCFASGLHIGATNVIFTMFIGAYVVFAHKCLAEKNCPGIIQFLAALFIIASAWFLNTDYNVFGVLLILALYVSQKKRTPVVLAIWSFLTYASLTDIVKYPYTYLMYAGFAFGAILFLKQYNGKRGAGNKWFMYIFYPTHLLILGLFARFFLR